MTQDPCRLARTGSQRGPSERPLSNAPPDPTPSLSALAADARLILESMGEAVITTDNEYKITYWNAAATAVYGWSAAEVMGERVTGVLATNWLSEHDRREAYAAAAAATRWRGEVAQRHRDGRRLAILSVVTVIRGEGGDLKGLVAVNRDLTPQREAERALEQAGARLAEVQGLDALGELVGSVSQDFNNLLAIIGGRTEIALDLLPGDHPAAAALAQIRGQVERGAALTGQMLSLGRRDGRGATNVDLCQLVRGIDEVLRRIVGGRHRLEFCVPTEPAWVHATHGELEQVLINLCSNARDAMTVSGRAKVCVVSPSEDVVELSVSDNGVGMTDEVRARAFEPFFTTKPEGKGTGLGLALVERVAGRCGGAVEVDSRPGGGTKVTLRLPRVTSPEASAVREAPRRLRILLAEDQELVRDVLAELLRALGHEVVAVADGRAAVDLAGPLDLFVTDVSMPRLSGPNAAAILRRRRPDLPVVYLSGFPKDEVAAASGEWPPGHFRLKPVTREALRDALDEALKERGARRPG